MTYDSEHYYAVQTFLDDDELCKIWNIIEIAMNREGYDVENAELSMRLYDSELEENIECDMEHLLGSQSVHQTLSLPVPQSVLVLCQGHL